MTAKTHTLLTSLVLALGCGLTTLGCGGGGGGSGGGGGTAPPPPAPPPQPIAQNQTTTAPSPTTSSPNTSTNTEPSSATISTSPSPSPSSAVVTLPGPSPTVSSSPAPSPSSSPAPSPSPSPSASPSPSPSPVGGSLPAPYTPSADTRRVYVSSSSGDDANSGLEEGSPKKTVSAGVGLLRDGYPDWLLFKRGDTWSGPIGRWKKSGRSASEPMLVGTYGSGARPLFKTGTSNGLFTDNGSSTPTMVSNLVFVGLHFYANYRDPASPDYTGGNHSGSVGFRWLRGSQNVIVDDCKFQSYHNNIVLQNYYGDGISNWTFRHIVCVDAYSGGSGHSQGLYASGVNGLVIEDSVFDHNGWNNTAGHEATIYNHNIYLQSSNSNLTVRRNVITRAASHGVQMRPGGLLEDNFCFQNPINLRIGYDDVTDAPGTMRRNVILEANDITASLPRGWGIELIDPGAVTIENNIVAHVATDSSNRRSIMSFANVTYTGNIVFDFPVNSEYYGANFATPGPWAEPNRSVQSYNAQQGGPGTVADFYDRVRSISRESYDAAYTATAINQYIRDGFVPQ